MSCKMRSVSFVDRLEYDFTGNHFAHALALGDVDGDGLNEFIIGNVEGTLAVFKGNLSKKPWRTCEGLGAITCVGTGDVFNSGKIQLACANTEGTLYIFSLYHRPSSSSSIHSLKFVDNPRAIKPVHQQDLPPNINVMLIAGIASDGKEELFIGHTDRVVAVYQWCSVLKRLTLKKNFTLSGQIGSLSVTMTHDGILQVLVSQAGGVYIPLWYKATLADINEPESLQESGRVGSKVMVKVEPPSDTEGGESESSSAGMADKESSVTMSMSAEEGTSLEGDQVKEHTVSSSLPSQEELEHFELIQGALVGKVQHADPTTSTEVVGDLHSQQDLVEGESHCNIAALCTLNGCVKFMKDEKRAWEHQVSHNLFTIAKLDLTNDGCDEIIVCSWDGTTYILDHSRNVVKYKFEENVCAFCAGLFGFSAAHNKPSFIYTTFSNKIYVYHCISLTTIPPSNLLLTYRSRVQENLPRSVSKTVEGLNDKERKELFRELLYKQTS